VNTWVVSSGHWLDDDGVLLGAGYSGGDHGLALEGVNNPRLQYLPRIGPIPCGFYVIGSPYDDEKCGEYTMSLMPNAANNMFGRSEFKLHGDLVTAPGQHKASDGCVILSLETRQAIWQSGDHDLHVIPGENNG